MRRYALAVILIVVVFVLVSALALAQPERTEATLVVLEGQATVIRNGALLAAASEQLVAANDVVTVSSGDEIRVGAAAAAQLRLSDGSTVDLFENTALEVTELLTTSETYQVRLNLSLGKVLSRIERALGIGDAFEIRTPSSTASVRGTRFTVEVLAIDVTHIVCEEGTVSVQMGGALALVTAGTQLTATVGQPLQVIPHAEEQPATIPEPLSTTAPAAPPQGGMTVTPALVLPTNVSTNQPIVIPEPTLTRSLATVLPTSVPVVPATGTATTAPTGFPPSLPTAIPTNLPTAVPTSLPTLIPTVLPTSIPTLLPTLIPTALPTFVPTLPPTVVPTAVPTPLPTNIPAPTPTSGFITICHYPPGNPNNAQTITVPIEDLPGHLGHGDTIGPCPN